jgi:hypothetical protein
MCREFAGLDVSVHKREEVIEAHPQDNRHVAMMPSHYKAFKKAMLELADAELIEGVPTSYYNVSSKILITT